MRIKPVAPLYGPITSAVVLPVARHFLLALPWEAVATYIFGACGMAFSVEMWMRAARE